MQAESAPVAVRQVKEDLSGLKVIAKVCPLPSPAPQIFCSVSHPPQEDGAFAEAVTKSKSKKERSQNKAVIDVADLFAGHFFGSFLLGLLSSYPHTLSPSWPRRRCPQHPSRLRPRPPWWLRRCLFSTKHLTHLVISLLPQPAPLVEDAAAGVLCFQLQQNCCFVFQFNPHTVCSDSGRGGRGGRGGSRLAAQRKPT